MILASHVVSIRMMMMTEVVPHKFYVRIKDYIPKRIKIILENKLLTCISLLILVQFEKLL